ncbi:tudor domain-containing protein [Ditylenchus destructor]|nr:tudor domain-containing protein [Ditylenchus destructor]
MERERIYDLGSNSLPKSDANSLLHIVFSEQVEQPIAKVDVLRHFIPIRFVAVIKRIEEDQRSFTISLLNDPRVEKEFMLNFQKYYREPVNRQQVSDGDIRIGHLYVFAVDDVYYRCRVENIAANQVEVFVIDVGTKKVIPSTALLQLDNEFSFGNAKYGFVLRCATPDPAALESLQLPVLSQFHVTDVIEAYIFSLHEPCVAVISSVKATYFSRIYHSSLVNGMDFQSARKWQALYMECASDNSVNDFCEEYGEAMSMVVNTGDHYPFDMPFLSETWSLAFVAALNALDDIKIRNIESSIRLTILQELLNDFYFNKKGYADLTFLDDTFLLPNFPCVFYEPYIKRYFRGKIVRSSADQSIADVIGVDFPSLSFKRVPRQDLFMLHDKFLIPPQCFAIRLLDTKDRKELLHYSKLARELIDVGSVVAVASSLDSTLSHMQYNNEEDFLSKIGYKNTNNCMSPSVTKILTTKTSMKPDLQSTIDQKNVKEIPNGAVEIMITCARNVNNIFYRTHNMATNYEELSTNLKRWVMTSSPVPLNSARLRVLLKLNGVYLLEQSGNFYRVRVTGSEGPNSSDIAVHFMDTGDQDECVDNSSRFYDIPDQFAKWEKPMIGLCALAGLDTSKQKYHTHPKAIHKLRTLLPPGKCVFMIEPNDQHCRVVRSPMRSKPVYFLRTNGDSINFDCAKIINELAKDDNQQITSWI